jgi:hypothetical protein
MIEEPRVGLFAQTLGTSARCRAPDREGPDQRRLG